jgi:hypothetical protein
MSWVEVDGLYYYYGRTRKRDWSTICELLKVAAVTMSAKEPMFNVGDLVNYNEIKRSRLCIVVRRKCIWQYTVKDPKEDYTVSNTAESTLTPVTKLTEADLAHFKANLDHAKFVYESALALVENSESVQQ